MVMIPRECKRLIEVDFPLAKVSYYAAREKSIRHGHPSTLHLWWARRPLASCRAVLLGLLLPDPEDPLCPPDFITRARELLGEVPGAAKDFSQGLRKALLHFIGEFANWDLAGNELWLDTARGLVKAAHPEETPLVVDPFAGGGSIPLEALRLGCEAFASDLNPVACLILKVLLEDIPRYGAKLAEELREVGTRIKEEAKQELAEFYPPDPDGAQPIAYLWARTVRCEAPHCGAEIPLIRSFWLCKKAGKKVALRPLVKRSEGQLPRIEFEIFSPTREGEVHTGTVSRAKAKCLACTTGAALAPERVRAQLVAQRGGADVIFNEKGERIGGARLLAVVTLQPGQQGRNYRLPADHDYQVVFEAQKRLKVILDLWEASGKNGLSPVPDEELPLMSGTFNVPLYGMVTWGDLFSARQKISLMSLSKATSQRSGPIRDLLSIAVDRAADGSAAITGWLPSGEEIKHVFSRQALPMMWDFGESNYLADASRSWESAINAIEKVVLTTAQSISSPGQIQSANACQHPLPSESTSVFFTDPPYYDKEVHARPSSLKRKGASR
jgi:putative DNA methylase